MVEVAECPVCTSKDFAEHYTCQDTTVSHETFNIKICPNCTLAITSPRPEEKDLGKYYLSTDYISHSGKTSGLIGRAYNVARKFTLNWKYRLVAFHSKKGTLLDYGCGTGEFLNTMQQRGWDVGGLEPSEIARNKAMQLTGKIIAETHEQLPIKRYNAITLWHVLEHVPDLNLVLQKLKNSLHHNGTIFIAVPNYQSPESLHYKNDWAGYDVPRHLWHFSKKSMELLLDQNNFKLHAVCPMLLDAYYISLLSEKNRGNTGLRGIVRAIIQGMHSNAAAKKTSNHSSLIYIAKLK